MTEENIIDTDHDLEDQLVDLIVESQDELGIDSVQTFDEAGVLSTDAGFIVKTADGSQYQVSIMQSR